MSLFRRTRPKPAADSGVSAIEFAFAAPVLLLALMATYDLVTYARLYFGLSATSTELAEVATQCKLIQAGDITRMQSELAQMTTSILAGRLPVISNAGAFWISAVQPNGNAGTVAWQQGAGNTALYPSRIGQPGGTAWTAGFTVPSGQVLIATEIYYAAPIWATSSAWMGGSGAQTLYTNAFYLSRSQSPSDLLTNPASSQATAQGCGS